MNGPDLEELERLCREEGNSDGKPCFPFCRKEDGDSCVTMTYFQRDVYNTIRYQSHFCGRGVDPSNQFKALQDSCHTQYSRDDYDVSACFCQTHKCNGSPGTISPHPSNLMQAILVTGLFLIIHWFEPRFGRVLSTFWTKWRLRVTTQKPYCELFIAQKKQSTTPNRVKYTVLMNECDVRS